MPSILDEIVSNKLSELEGMKKVLSLEELRAQVQTGQGKFLAALQTPGIHLITEIKPKSPSAGVLRKELDLPTIVDLYGKYASAISVLTDEKFFAGSFELLETVSESTDLPLLCKDFVVDPYQCFKARSVGAEAVLLIAKILDDEQFSSLHETIISLGMCPVVEVQNEQEVERALKLNPQVMLINNRNLQSFEVQLDTTTQLVNMLPPSVIVISASGIEGKRDIEQLKLYCSHFLIGSSLMRAENLESKLKELKSVKFVEKAKRVAIPALAPAGSNDHVT